jgi:hypothetical protein
VVQVNNGNRVVDRQARIEEWNKREDGAAADFRRELGPTTREERLARAEERRQQREIRQAVDRDAIDAVQ